MTPAGGKRRLRVPKDRRAASGRASRGSRVTPRSARSRGSLRQGRRLGAYSLISCAVVLVMLAAIAIWPGDLFGRSPEPPGGLKVISQDTTATATWDRETATAFRVEYSKSLDFADARRRTVDRNTLELSSLLPGTTYFLRVATIRGDRVGDSRLVRFTTDFRYPAPKLILDSNSSTSLAARWTSDVKKMKYEAQIDQDEAFGSPKTVTVNERKARFAKLDRDATYSVRVRMVDSTGLALSGWSAKETRKTSRSAPLRVGSFNVLKASKANWSARRLAVAETITSHNLDVVGLQEAVPSSIRGVPQYVDIVRVLGSDWAMTEMRKKGPPGETRTIYNTKRLKLVDHGYQAITGSTRFGVMRYVTWAIFEQKSTTKKFVFINTHFATHKGRSRSAHRTQAAAQLVKVAKAVSERRLPVVIAGDFNSAAHRNNGNGVYRNITRAGYIDPLVRTGKLGAAKKLINADLKTVNKLARYPRRDASAAMIDHMFVSSMKVAVWETVAKLDRNGRVIGTIPSDHNMIRLTVYLP